MKGTQKDDAELMETALKEFQERAREKFLAGIQEHNSKGDKGMLRMDITERIKCAKEEVIDLWFYLSSIENQHPRLGSKLGKTRKN